jgi:hypothetical protein
MQILQRRNLTGVSSRLDIACHVAEFTIGDIRAGRPTIGSCTYSATSNVTQLRCFLRQSAILAKDQPSQRCAGA